MFRQRPSECISGQELHRVVIATPAPRATKRRRSIQERARAAATVQPAEIKRAQSLPLGATEMPMSTGSPKHSWDPDSNPPSPQKLQNKQLLLGPFGRTAASELRARRVEDLAEGLGGLGSAGG